MKGEFRREGKVNRGGDGGKGNSRKGVGRNQLRITKTETLQRRQVTGETRKTWKRGCEGSGRKGNVLVGLRL